MNTLLFLSFFLLCFTDTTGLLCHVCKESYGSDCLAGRGICTAPENGACSSTAHFKGGRHLYSEQTCASNCENSQSVNKLEVNVTMCCNKNLCNIF